jgi:hypothetical protein
VTEGPAIVRSIVAVGAGFFATSMLSLGGDAAFRAVAPQAFDAHGYAREGGNLLVVLAYVGVFECAGGYITARLAIRQPLGHAFVLGVVVLVPSLVVSVLTWNTTPKWYQIAALALIVPMSLLGGKLRELQVSRGAR